MRIRIQALAARFAQATPRERLLLAALVLGGLIYAPVAAGDWRAVQQERYIDALTERAAAQLAVASARRVAAVAADVKVVEDMESWGFDASNLAVAQVSVEQRLVEAASEAGLTDVRISTRNEVEAIGLTQWLGTEVQASLVWTPVFDFLDRISAWPEGFRITRIQYEMTVAPGSAPMASTSSPTSGTLRLGLAFPVNLATPPAAERAP